MNQKVKLSKEDDADKVDEGYYRSLIECLMYLTVTRPDILFAVSLLSRFMHCASEIHLRAAKRILRYIRATIDYGVKLRSVKNSSYTGSLTVIGLVGQLDSLDNILTHCSYGY